MQKTKKNKGGSKVTLKPIDNFNIENNYSSEELGLIHKHTMSLHHNKFDLSIIANLNLDGKNTMYYTDRQKAEDGIKTILETYKIWDSYKHKENNKISKKYFLNCPNFYHCSLTQTLFVGEGRNKKSKIERGEPEITPIFLNDDDRGYFYDINGHRYIPTFKKRVSSIINKVVYIFELKEEYKNPHIDKHSQEIVDNLQNGEKISNVHLIKTVGIDNEDENKNIIYKFDRIRVTKEQKETISTTYLDYKIIHSLNNDDSLIKSSSNETIDQYKRNQKFNFFSYDKIKKGCSSWYSFTPNEQFKKCLLVGFSQPYNGIRRAIYLKANGYFSDGYADYYPTFETIKINEKIIEKLFNKKYKDDSMNFLIGKVAYTFSYGSSTLWNYMYNQDFRDKMYATYVWGPINTCAVGLIIAGIFAVAPALWGSAVIMPSIPGTILTSLEMSTAIKGTVGAIDYIGNNKVRGKEKYKEGGKTQKKKKKTQKRKRFYKIKNNISIVMKK